MGGAQLREVGLGLLVAVALTVVLPPGQAQAGGAVLPRIGGLPTQSPTGQPSSSPGVFGTAPGASPSSLPVGSSSGGVALAAYGGKVFLFYGGRLMRFDAATLRLESVVDVPGAATTGSVSGGSSGSSGGGGTSGGAGGNSALGGAVHGLSPISGASPFGAAPARTIAK